MTATRSVAAARAGAPQRSQEAISRRRQLGSSSALPRSHQPYVQRYGSSAQRRCLESRPPGELPKPSRCRRSIRSYTRPPSRRPGLRPNPTPRVIRCSGVMQPSTISRRSTIIRTDHKHVTINRQIHHKTYVKMNLQSFKQI